MKFQEMVRNFGNLAKNDGDYSEFYLFQDPPTALQDRLIQACMAGWNASFAYETARLLNDLQAIDPELAAELRAHAPECFGREPAPDAAYYRRVLKNIF